MQTIQTTLTITEKGEILIPAIVDWPPGEHKVVLTIEEEPEQLVDATVNPLAGLRTFVMEGWPADATYSRQEIYDDDGR